MRAIKFLYDDDEDQLINTRIAIFERVVLILLNLLKVKWGWLETGINLNFAKGKIIWNEQKTYILENTKRISRMILIFWSIYQCFSIRNYFSRILKSRLRFRFKDCLINMRLSRHSIFNEDYFNQICVGQVMERCNVPSRGRSQRLGLLGKILDQKERTEERPSLL